MNVVLLLLILLNVSPFSIIHRMLKELKAPQKDSHAWCNQSDHLQMAEDILSAVRRVRREVVDCMRVLMKYAKVKVDVKLFLYAISDLSRC